METNDNQEYQPSQPQQDTTYHSGPQQRTSPYANSPYEMHQQAPEYHYQPASQPPQQPPKPPRKPIWKTVLPAPWPLPWWWAAV